MKDITNAQPRLAYRDWAAKVILRKSSFIKQSFLERSSSRAISLMLPTKFLCAARRRKLLGCWEIHFRVILATRKQVVVAD
jgi:hypothetical protein